MTLRVQLVPEGQKRASVLAPPSYRMEGHQTPGVSSVDFAGHPPELCI